MQEWTEAGQSSTDVLTSLWKQTGTQLHATCSQEGSEMGRIQLVPWSSSCPGRTCGRKLERHAACSSWKARSSCACRDSGKRSVFRKARNHRSVKGTPCVMPCAAVHWHTSAGQELNATSLGKGRVWSRVALKPGGFSRSAGGMNDYLIPLLTNTPCMLPGDWVVLLYQVHWLLLMLHT